MAIKQKRLAPGREFNYAEGVLVVAGEAITADNIVVAKDREGGLLEVWRADASVVSEARGKLFIAKHDIPVGGRGVVLPWKVMTGLVTNVVGTPLYLHEDGAFSATPSSNSRILRQVGTYVDTDAAMLDPGLDQGVEHLVPDPGNAGAIPVTQSGFCPLVSAGTESRTLANPTRVNQELVLFMKTDLGDITVTVATAINQTGNTVATFNDAGDVLVLRAIQVGANLRWRVIANDGVGLS